MAPRLSLGYRTATAEADSPVATAGETVTGHEFHRTVTTPRAGTDPAWSWPGANPRVTSSAASMPPTCTPTPRAAAGVARFCAHARP